MTATTRRALLAAAAVLSWAGSAWSRSPPAPTPMTIMIYEAGPAWKAGRPMQEQGLGPHLAYVGGLFSRGRLVAYGPQADAVRGYYVLAGGDPASASRFVADDPAIKARIFKAEAPHAWAVLIDGFRAKEPDQAYAILRMQPGPNWAAGKTLSGQDVSAHFAYMADKAKAGVVVAAGPDGSGQEGWYVVRGDRAAIDGLLAADPGVKGGVLKPVVVTWNVLDMQASSK